MLVDGVIVTTEYADRRISQRADENPPSRWRLRMSWPIIASTVTTLMSLPLLFWPGIVGGFMKYLPITVICVLSASLIMALIFVPVLGGMIGKKAPDKGVVRRSAPRSYRWVQNALSLPVFGCASCGWLYDFFFGAYFSAGLGVSFFPDIEPEQAVVEILARGDLAAEEKDLLVQQAEGRILDVTGVSAKYAKSGPRGWADDSIGFIRTVFEDWQTRKKATVLIDEMRGKLDGLAGVDVSITAQQGGPGGGKPIHIEVFNTDLDIAANATAQIIALMQEMGGFVDITDRALCRALNGQFRLTVMKPHAMAYRLMRLGIWSS